MNITVTLTVALEKKPLIQFLFSPEPCQLFHQIACFKYKKKHSVHDVNVHSMITKYDMKNLSRNYDLQI